MPIIADENKVWPSPPQQNEEEQKIVQEGKTLFKTCVGWEAIARLRFDYDYKFANADAHNKYQWEDKWINKRELEDRPCLTINKTQVHNLLIINDAKMNKPGVRARPVGDEATFEAAQIFQELIYHIEYISNAENVYDNAVSFQVQGGIGYWRVLTDFYDDREFDQEIYIRRIKDPRSVYLDPNINEQDGSDAYFGFLFDDMSKDLFKQRYPKFAAIANQAVFGEGASEGWITQNNVRVCEYFRKEMIDDRLVYWRNPQDGVEVKKFVSELNDIEKFVYSELKKDDQAPQRTGFRQRKVQKAQIEWFKIAGDKIIDRGIWLGKYIPIVRVVGTETVINGELDRKGHTRALINPQQMYNVNSSANIEFGALQTKSPYVGPAKAFENLEEYWKTANSINHAFLPYNHVDDEGNEVPRPERSQPPVGSPAYVQAMQISQNEMMMATGQYQSQMGENENAKSGVAINARQRQGDRATYHFVDNLAIAIRFTGKILLDLIPKIYDTRRIMQITTVAGQEMRVIVDPEAKQSVQELQDLKVKDKTIKQIVFNPNVGIYDLRADTGPSFATRRMEAFNAMMELGTQNKDFMERAGDIVFKVADFPEADVLAERWKKFLPPNITGDGPDPQVEAAMNAATSKISQLTNIISEQTKKLADREKEFDIKEAEIDLRRKEASSREHRGDYDAETKRLTAFGNSGPAIAQEQIEPALRQLLQGMIANGELIGPGISQGGTPIQLPTEEGGDAASGDNDSSDKPPVPDAKKAKDGHWYVQQEGQYYRVDTQ